MATLERSSDATGQLVLRNDAATSHPRAEKYRAVARPMPDEHPVTRITRRGGTEVMVRGELWSQCERYRRAVVG